MLLITPRDDFHVDIEVVGNYTTNLEALAAVTEYTAMFKHRPPHQTVHVRIHDTVVVKWEQVLQIIGGVRKFHFKNETVDEAVIYLTEKSKLKMFKSLLGLFSTAVRISFVET